MIQRLPASTERLNYQERTKEGSEKLYEITEQIIKKHVEKGNLK